MAHFAEIDDNNIVLRVVNVNDADTQDEHGVEDEAIGRSFLSNTYGGNWIQTSYNTRGGVHLLGGTPLRKNYAGLGYTYSKELDAFIPPKPYETWIFYPQVCLWGPPDVPYPNDLPGNYYWNASEQSWQLITAST